MVLFFGMTIPWSAFLGAPDPSRSLLSLPGFNIDCIGMRH
jgi:hypothetical protein